MIIVDGWTRVTLFRGTRFFDFLARPCWPCWPVGGGGAFDAWRRFCGTTSCTYKKGAMASEGSSIHVLPAIPFELANLKKIYLRPQAPFPEHVCFPLWRASFILFTRFLLPIWTCSLVAERKHCSSTSLNTNMICVDLSKIEEATLRATKWTFTARSNKSHDTTSQQTTVHNTTLQNITSHNNTSHNITSLNKTTHNHRGLNHASHNHTFDNKTSHNNASHNQTSHHHTPCNNTSHNNTSKHSTSHNSHHVTMHHIRMHHTTRHRKRTHHTTIHHTTIHHLTVRPKRYTAQHYITKHYITRRKHHTIIHLVTLHHKTRRHITITQHVTTRIHHITLQHKNTTCHNNTSVRNTSHNTTSHKSTSLKNNHVWWTRAAKSAMQQHAFLGPTTTHGHSWYPGKLQGHIHVHLLGFWRKPMRTNAREDLLA